MATTMITYGAELAAFASPLRVHFAPPLDQQPDSDPVRRFVYAMAIFAKDVSAGEARGPYDPQAAELYARTMLIDAAEFDAHAADTDQQLAERFNVPLEQIPPKRADVLTRQAR